MPTIYTIIAYWSWFALLLVWLPGYFTGKRTVRRPNPVRRLVANILLIIGYIFLFSQSGFGSSSAGWLLSILHIQLTPQTAVFGIVGLIIADVGIALAIWARIVLGSNWSNAIVLKENHELIQTGPYAIVRHPIYTGMLFATIGTALTIGRVTDYLSIIFILVAFLIRIQDEDALMAEQFPQAHPTYRQQTKKLIPFVW